MSATQTEERYRAARAFVAQLVDANKRGPEDAEFERGALLATLRDLESAAAEFTSENRSVDAARAEITAIDIRMKLDHSPPSWTHGQSALRTALQSLDAADDPASCLEAYVLIAQVMLRDIAHAPQGGDREKAIDQLTGLLGAAEFLAGEQNAALQASVQELSSRALGERFRGDRDANLLDAIAAARRALPTYLESAHETVDYASLLLHVGNCYLQLDGPRKRWLEEANAAYSAALAGADAQRYPRLRRILEGNVELVRSLYDARDGALPEKEMMGRFGWRIQQALQQRDLSSAEATAWEAIRWAWAQQNVPNVWLAESHKIIGTMLLRSDRAQEALPHFRCAVAVLCVISDPGGPQQDALLQGAVQLVDEALAVLNLSDKRAEVLTEASNAFPVARAHVQRGAQALDHDPAAAYGDFNHALALFPFDPLALFYRGSSLLALNELRAAVADFDAAVQLRPTIPSIANRALIRMQLGDADGALTDYAAVLEADPNNIVALYNRAVILRARGNLVAALEDVDRLLNLQPDLQPALALRAALRPSTE
jgi:tetratricopeptide (TPR) repeat protein